MAQQTDAELLDEAAIIKDETAEGANTADRVGTMIENIIDSKLNNEGVGTLIAAATGKTTPVDGDSTIISDSEASGAQKKLTWANLKATLKTYFDSLYQAALGYTAENTSNKSNSYTLTSTTTYPNTKALVDGLAAERTYAEGLVVGHWDDRGNFNASVNAYPSSGGSGTAGAIVKGDIWTISVAGTLPTGQSVEVGDTVRALIDSPGNTQANWAIAQNNIGYAAENSANKTDTITGNESSSTLYASIKGIYDWISGLTIISKDVTSNAMLTTSANTIKIDTTASGSFDNLIATDLPNNIQAALQALGGPVIVEPFTGITAGSFPLSFTPSPLFDPLIFSFDSLGVVRYENFQSNISGSTLNFVNPSGGVGPYNVNVHYKKTI